MFKPPPEMMPGKQATVSLKVFRVPVFLLLGLILSAPYLRADDTGFSVKFTEKKALFSGEVDSEESAQALAKAVKLARPDIEIVNEGIHVNEKMTMPSLNDLKSILAEIGLSTHEGRFSINDNTIVVSGLTDSLVTSTALMIRLRPIRGNRLIISHICVVPTEDLPNIPIILANGETTETLIDFDPKPSLEASFEIPGILSAKLSSLILFISNHAPLKGDATSLTAIPATPAQKLRAVPVTMIPRLHQDTDEAAISLPPVRTEPIYKELNPVLFSRNTFLLQANQEPVVQETVKVLQDARFSGKRIVLRAMKPQSGSATFNDWLCERRAEEVKTMLTNNGITTGIMTTETVDSKKTVDMGEVRLFVVIPPPPQPPQQVVQPSESESGTTLKPEEKKSVTISIE